MKKPYDCISELVFVETSVEEADVILVPGDSHPQLMEKAAELYHNKFARYILPSGGLNPKLVGYETEWEYLRAIGIELGVPDHAILKEDKARHTFENAELTWNVLQTLNKPIRKVILVCKAYHSRRALLTYQSIFPTDVEFYVSPVIDKRGITRDNWFLDSEKISLVMGEVVKIGKYFEDKIQRWVTKDYY
jgi:uncharacterized SAM-binding protein YcdF (DUF218 family)